MHSEFTMITPMSVKNSIVIGEVFQIEVSDGIAQPLASHQNVNLYPARVFTGHTFAVRVFTGHTFGGVCVCL